MRVVVAAWVGSTNLGDELVFAGLRRKLVDRGAAVCAVSLDPAATRAAHGVAAIDHRDVGALAAAVGQADAVVFGGGGLLQDETSPFNLPYHLSRVWLALLRRTPFAAVGVGAGRLDTRAGRMLTAWTLRHARGVSVRDAASAELLQRLGVCGVTPAADLAVGVEAPVVEADDHLAVCLRPWQAARGRLPASLRGDPTPQAFVDAAARALDEAAGSSGLAVRFVALQRDRDGALHRRVGERMREPWAAVEPDLHGLLAEVASARAVVAMRYHGGIAAVLAGRPCVLVGYAPKVAALAAELGHGGSLLDWRPDALTRMPAALGAVSGHETDMAAARDRLRERDRANDAVLDELLRA